MTARFFDRQDETNPLNGTRVRDEIELRRLLDQVRDREPFFAELIDDDGLALLLGIGASRGCVQLSPADGSTPYLMAVAHDAQSAAEGHVEFLTGGTATPVPKRFSLPYETMVEIAARFVTSGERHGGVAWEEV